MSDSFPSEYEMLADTFVRAMHIVTDLQEVLDLCTVYFQRMGAKLSSYHHLPPLGARDYTPTITVYASGFPDAWVRRYMEEKFYQIDPIPRHAISQSEHFWWSEARSFSDLTAEELRYLDILEEQGLGDGIAIPVFGPNSRNGYVGVGFGAEQVDVPPLIVSRIVSAAQIGHQRLCKLLCDRSKEDVLLSDREREILTWIVRGKSNSVIADIVGISNHTVDTYLKRIYAKLDVSSRVMAALRGVAIGAIT